MTRPLKIKYSGATAIGLQEMTDAEIDYVAHQICANIAAQTSGTGPLTLNVNGATGTSIGTFTDTYYPDASGTHPAGTTVTSVTYTFKQIQTTDATAPTRPLEWSTSALREMTDANMTTIWDRVTSYLSGAKLGSYVLQATAPATGTWTSIATITNTTQSGTTNTTTLWRCTAYTAPTAVRPTKIFGTGMKEMSDAEIKTLFGKYSAYVNASGPGKYLVQSATPTGGTWVRMGAQFDDNRYSGSNINYTGTYSATYTGAYSTSYSGTYTSYFSGAYTRYWAGSRQKAYSRSYSGYTRANYTGTYSATYSPGSYTGAYSTSYTGSYAGTRSKSYAGTRSHTYTGFTISGTTETVSNVSLWLRTA